MQEHLRSLIRQTQVDERSTRHTMDVVWTAAKLIIETLSATLGMIGCPLGTARISCKSMPLWRRSQPQYIGLKGASVALTDSFGKSPPYSSERLVSSSMTGAISPSTRRLCRWTGVKRATNLPRSLRQGAIDSNLNSYPRKNFGTAPIKKLALTIWMTKSACSSLNFALRPRINDMPVSDML